MAILNVLFVILIFDFNLCLVHRLQLEIREVIVILRPSNIPQMPVLGVVLRLLDRGVLLLHVGVAWASDPELLQILPLFLVHAIVKAPLTAQSLMAVSSLE